MTLVYDDISSVGTTALAFFVGVGSRDEDTQEWGAAHLLEHLLFKGAGPWDYRAIAREMDKLGADINAFTTRDYTCFYARVLDTEALAAYQLLSAMVREPWLKGEDFVREKNVVIEEMRESRDDPDDMLDLLLTEALYQDPAYTHDILGTAEVLKAMPLEILTRFFERHYQPSQMVFAVSGGAREAVLGAVHQDFSEPHATTILPIRRSVPAMRLASRHRRAEWEQLHLGLSVPAPHRYHPHYWAALLTAGLLGGQNSARLWQRLREEEGLVYTIATQYGPDYDFGEMSTYLSLGPELLTRALTALSEELQRLAQEGPDGDELERIQTSLYTMLVMAQETPDARIMRLGRAGLDQQIPVQLIQVEQHLREVSPLEVQSLAGLWTQNGAMAAAWTGPTTESVNHQIQQFVHERGL